MTDPDLKSALHQYLISRGHTLSTNPLDNIQVPLSNGDTLLIPVLFMDKQND